MRAKAWVVWLAVLCAWPWSASAQADGTTEARVARARKHFVLGMQFFEVRAYRDAIREFELATALAPSADVWFNIGRAREELGEDEQAKQAFERYLRDRVDAPDKDAVRARIDAIDQRLAGGARGTEMAVGTGSLRVHLPESAPKGARVTLDGEPLAEGLRLRPIILPAGRHRLEVTSAGYVPFRAEVSIESGMLTAAHTPLQPLSRGEPSQSGSRTWTWVAVGLAGAGAVTAGVLGAIALDHQSDGEFDEARAWARRSDVALVGTSVCALAAALLYFIEAPAQPQPEPERRTSTSTAADHASR
ncbi:MAG TPA: PEGA domain-containing protein [Polyangiales bacterium]|nr:PEGA domain-containing protein [Polyangiales bacterium]